MRGPAKRAKRRIIFSVHRPPPPPPPPPHPPPTPSTLRFCAGVQSIRGFKDRINTPENRGLWTVHKSEEEVDKHLLE